MTVAAREIHLKARPDGLPNASDFELVTRTLPEPAQGQLLVRTTWMSVDPYMRGRMRNRPSYIAPFQVGEALEGAAIGLVERSADPRFKAGDTVSHFSGWRDYALVDAATVSKIDVAAAPEPAWLGPLGIPGFTAYVGLGRVGELKPGETVFVSAAAGAVGSMAVQIAKAKGARVIVSAGSDDKVAWVRDELGAEAAINYRTAGDLGAALAAAAPEGVDVYFDNVGGQHLDAALANANNSARFVICGMIAGYNDEPPVAMRNLAEIVIKRISLRGYIVLDHTDLLPEFTGEMTKWIADGSIKWRDTVVEGLDSAPAAFLGLFSGENVGKMLVKIGG